MAIWNRNKVPPANLNAGQQYNAEDWTSEQTFNAANNNAFYAVDYAEALGDTPDTSQVGNIGTPTVTLIDNVKTIDGIPKTFKKFKFANLKGEKGDAGINDALVVQEFGTSTEDAISQKVITDKFDDLETQLAEKANIPTTGNTRGINATDFQFERTTDDQVASGHGSFIAGGQNNKIADVVKRDSHANYGHAEGYGNSVYEQYGHAEGNSCIVDGKVAHAENNCNICSANDSHAEGNRTVAGRKYFATTTIGSEDAGDSLGVLQYIVIPDAEGDVSSYFPNALFTDITTRYGAGAQKDAKGNVYPSGMTPAVWTGDTPTTVNELKWAMHTVCILRGAAHEYDIAFADIAKAVYTVGTGTKIYYFGAMPYASLIGIYSSYSPLVSVGDIQGGNGEHAEGLFTSTYGYGTHAEGLNTRAWNSSAHAEGDSSFALGIASHAEGYYTKASGKYAHSENISTIASGESSHAEGSASEASGKYSHAQGYHTKATAEGAHAEGNYSEATARYSRAKGAFAKAPREYQQSYSVAKNTATGDNQVIEMQYKYTAVDAGWHVLSLLEGCEAGKAYNFETMVLGRQKAGTAGTVGDTFAYKFSGCFVLDGTGACTVLGTPARTLIGRSSGMEGDGLSTGVRISWYGLYPSTANVVLRMDSMDATTFIVNTYSTIQEMGL